MRDESAKQPSITESPWYWIYLFATGGVVALVLMGPRFSARQAQIEQKYQGRQRAAQQLHGIQPSTPLSSVDETAVKLGPLYLVMGGLLAVAWARLWWTRFRRPGVATSARPAAAHKSECRNPKSETNPKSECSETEA